MYETAALRSAVVSDHIKRGEPNDGNNVGHRRWVRATGGETRQDVTVTRHDVEWSETATRGAKNTRHGCNDGRRHPSVGQTPNARTRTRYREDAEGPNGTNFSKALYCPVFVSPAPAYAQCPGRAGVRACVRASIRNDSKKRLALFFFSFTNHSCPFPSPRAPLCQCWLDWSARSASEIMVELRTGRAWERESVARAHRWIGGLGTTGTFSSGTNRCYRDYLLSPTLLASPKPSTTQIHIFHEETRYTSKLGTESRSAEKKWPDFCI